jgi:hypothetical protein
MKEKCTPPGWVEPSLGEGISRPRASERTRLYALEVRQPGSPLMRVTIPAPTKAKALMYCRNRWPGCTAEVLG